LKDSSFDVIVLGYIFDENICFPDHKIGPFLGGTASYSGICLSRLGTRTGIVSNIGKDTSLNLLKPFYDANVNTQGLNMKEGISITKNLLIYDEKGNKTIKYLVRAPEILYADIPDMYFGTKIFYLCPVDYEIPVNTVKNIKKKGTFKIVADLGGFGGAHSSIESRKKYGKNILKILKVYMQYIDIAKVSMEDCYHLFGTTINSPEQALKKILGYGASIVIVTLGEKGALIGTKDKAFNISPIEANVVDRTGAGDVFTSGFLSEYLVSSDIERAGIFATATSSLLIEKTGGVNTDRIPSRQDVLNRMKKYVQN